MTGSMIPGLMGKPLNAIRVFGESGKPIPFQIDEVTAEGEYVLPLGEEPNIDQGNGVLDSLDEIVFLWEDAAEHGASPLPDVDEIAVELSHEEEKRTVFLALDASLPVSEMRYIEYRHNNETLTTPYFYAVFGRDRFHFVRAGVRDFAAERYVDLTNELRIEIYLRMFWGLIPVRYTEESIVCVVKRYKVGPVRLIRRGDFHLNVGLGVKGSRAAVNQVCYPQLVCVPVQVHLPVRFKSFFRQAYIEMSPVITPRGRDFTFNVPKWDIRFPMKGSAAIDTLVSIVPRDIFFKVDNGRLGYGWLLQTNIPHRLLEGSGFVFQRPSPRGGIGHCGFHLTLQDLPRGYYDIVNWVLFSRGGADRLEAQTRRISSPAAITVSGGSPSHRNALSK